MKLEVKQKLVLKVTWGLHIEIHWYRNRHDKEETLQFKDGYLVDAELRLSPICGEHCCACDDVIHKSQSAYILLAPPFSSILEIPIFLRLGFIQSLSSTVDFLMNVNSANHTK